MQIEEAAVQGREDRAPLRLRRAPPPRLPNVRGRTGRPRRSPTSSLSSSPQPLGVFQVAGGCVTHTLISRVAPQGEKQEGAKKGLVGGCNFN